MNRIKIAALLFSMVFLAIVACGSEDELPPGELKAVQDDLACHKACDETAALGAIQNDQACHGACELACEEKCDQEYAVCVGGCTGPNRDMQALCIRGCVDRLTFCYLLCQQGPNNPR